MNLKEIIKDLAQNNHESFQAYLQNRFGAKSVIEGDYVGKYSVDTKFKHIKEERLNVLERMLDILELEAEKKFGKDVLYIPLMMNKLIPETLVIELWAYKLTPKTAK